MARIYISSTYKDLKAHREVVYRTLRQLGHDVIAMEDYVATDVRPLDKCLQDVAACDLYVGIFAFAYGYIPATDNPDRASITELEYRKAGTAGVPRLIFMVADGATWPTSSIDALVHGDGRRIADLRAELGREHTDSFFESSEEVARKVSVAVSRELQRTRLKIDWDAPRRRFIEHMRAFAGARSDQDALNRYVPLRLQATRAKPPSFELLTGTWADLVSYPAQVLLTGEAGSGKTTLLLHETDRLAQLARERQDMPVPLYLPLKSFSGGDGDTLLEMAAQANQMDVRVMRALWSGADRPVCLVLDGGDETAYRDQLVDAIVELGSAAATTTTVLGNEHAARSLIVACHPGPLQDCIIRLQPAWTEFLLLPLRRTDIDNVLTRYDAPTLIPLLDDERRQIVRRPDLLAALAQSVREISAEGLPRTAADIYTLYFRHIFSKLGGRYDYTRIKRPVLARIAYDMVCSGRDGVPCDDTLYEWMATMLDELNRAYYRRRSVMPHDWSAEDLHDELLRSPVVDSALAGGQLVTFSKPAYRDYFAAVHVVAAGIRSRDSEKLTARVAASGQLGPLSFALGINADAAALLDTLPARCAPGAAQIWLADGPQAGEVPGIIRNGYEERRARVAASLDSHEMSSAPGMQSVDPRRRLEEVQRLAAASPLRCASLLEAATDANPLVRASAQYALLNAGDPSAGLTVVVSKHGLQWRSFGAGTAVLGPLTLLRLPVPMVVDLVVEIQHLDFDPFDAQSEFAFIPLSAALFAEELFLAGGHVDWLELLARFQVIAASSAELAQQAATQAALAPFGTQLARRAAEYAGVGRTLAARLRLPWLDVQLPDGIQVDEYDARCTLRALTILFNGDNQARTLRLAHLTEDAVLDTRISIKRVEGGKAVGMRIDQLVSDDDDHEDSPRFTFITGKRKVETVRGGSVYGLEIGRIKGGGRQLPLNVHIDDVTEIEDIRDAEVGAIRIQSFEGRACPWRVRAAFRIGRCANSQFAGVVVCEAAPAAVEGDSAQLDTPV